MKRMCQRKLKRKDHVHLAITSVHTKGRNGPESGFSVTSAKSGSTCEYEVEKPLPYPNTKAYHVNKGVQ